MRTFIALAPPQALRRTLGRLCRELEPFFPGLRWSRPEHIHLTLRFLGEIDPADLDRLVETVGGVARMSPRPRLSVSGPGWFGSPREPRVIWLGLADNAELQALSDGLEKALRGAGFGRADKPFQAHLTLARIKKTLSRPPDWERVKSAAALEWPVWDPDTVEIIKSTLTQSGPEYETLADLALQTPV